MNKLSQRLGICLCVVAVVGLSTPIRGRSAEHVETLEEHLVRTNPLGPMLGNQVLLEGRGMQTSTEVEGRLEAEDGQWLRIRTKDGQLISYSVANVIFVKLEQAAKP
jgi:hypothetical protein